MKVFITGASGFIGNGVARAFRRRGHRVTGLVRREEAAALLRAQEIMPVIGELERPQSYLKAAEDAEVLIHCAYESSSEAVKRDAIAVDTLIKAASAGHSQRKLIYTSGVWLYGNTHGEVVDEHSPNNPIAFSKWRAEHEEKILNAATKNVHPVVTRPGCLYGYSGSLTSEWFESAKKGAVAIYGDGNNRWSMIHLDDLACAYVKIAERPIKDLVINITDGSQHTLLEMAEAAATVAGIPGKVKKMAVNDAVYKEVSYLDGLLIDQKVSNQRAIQLLDWYPRHISFVSDIKLYYAAWKESHGK